MLGKRDVVNRSMELSLENPMWRGADLEVPISKELKDLKHAEFIEKKRRQQLRTDCEELRQLAEHLRLAAITKDLCEQRAELQKSRLEAEKDKAKSHQLAETERLRFLAEEQKKEVALKEQQKKLRDCLALQMEQTQQRRKKECVETVADRELRMALQLQIEEEDRALQYHLEQEKIRKRRDMNRLIEEKKTYKEFKNKEEEVELKKALRTQTQMDERKQRLDHERLEVRRKHEEITTQLGYQLYKLDSEKRQRENVLLDLLESEYKAKDDERFRHQLQQEEMDRIRVKKDLERYRAEVLQRNKEQMEMRRQELAAEQELLLTINPDAIEKEQELAEQQRRRDHGNILLSMIKENQRKRANAMAENVQFFSMKDKADKELQERIQRERLEMLDTHADTLAYLPNHVLSKADREHFGIKGKRLNGDV
ncbi:uncharacterized protein Dwil_GK13186 [Drosophila willistoni]|uniref:Meiosis-specific nuclear structural protein 1 n=1 Tax=Drosophila willistoni TaxID=7260 RepID=B4NLG3_DROWI|nr:meiosis-specific nuclear structural protein 1 [Drosophila willistoni]EDW84366.1 uncharacterized protein Dwil_GK13186 [Drosophila willistoni]